MHSIKLQKRMHRYQFIKAMKRWLQHLDEEKPWGMNTFSWNHGRQMRRKDVEELLKKLTSV
jgi:hypothetical protein